MKEYNHINFIHFHTIESTNTWVKENSEMLDPSQITCISAYEQTGGRGRFQRKWFSSKGESLLATYFFTLPHGSSIVSNVGQTLSISCCNALSNLGFLPQSKWPNDVMIDQKKIAGILCETVTTDQGRIGIALGIGLNVNLELSTLENLDQPATSLKILSGKSWSLHELLDKISQEFLQNLNTLISRGFEPLHPFYERNLAFKGEPVVYEDGNRLFYGTCHSVSKKGSLILLSDEGQEIELTAGSMLKREKALAGV